MSDRAALEIERAYNPRAAVPDHRRITQERAAVNRQTIDSYLHEALPYGQGRNEVIDVYHPPGERRDDLLAIYIHGGYWRAGHRSDYAFAALPFLRSGVSCAVIGYELCPHVPLPGIVDGIEAAVAALHRWSRQSRSLAADRFLLCGMSAGAHLTASLLQRPRQPLHDCDVVAFLLSGIFDLRPVLDISLNQEIRLDLETAVAMSPQFQDALPRARHVELVVGTQEPEPWKLQSRRYASKILLGGIGTAYREIDGANHFSLSDGFLDPASELSRWLSPHLFR